MPSITDASLAVKEYPNLFVSPYGNDGVIPLYSSVPLKSPVEGCLDCIVCGNSIVRQEIITSSSQSGNKLLSQVTISPSTNNLLSFTKTQNATAQFPGGMINWEVKITNFGSETHSSTEVANSFGGASLISSNFTYNDYRGAFIIGDILANSTITLNFTTQMPCDMRNPVQDVSTITGVGTITKNVSLSFSPTLIYQAAYPYSWNDANNFFNLDGTPANRIPNGVDRVYALSNIWDGTPSANSILISQGSIGGGNPTTPTDITTLGGLTICCGSICYVPTIHGDLYIRGTSITSRLIGQLIQGNVFLFDSGSIGGYVTVQGNVTMRNTSYISFANTINGSLIMYDSSYHDPGNSYQYLNVTGNLDAYSPVPKPVQYVNVSGTTTYHNYP